VRIDPDTSIDDMGQYLAHVIKKDQTVLLHCTDTKTGEKVGVICAVEGITEEGALTRPIAVIPGGDLSKRYIPDPKYEHKKENTEEHLS